MGMRILQFLYLFVLIVFFLSSCKKELSEEHDWTDRGSGGKPCAISTVTPYDSYSGTSYGSFQISKATNNTPGKIEWYDNTQGSKTYFAVLKLNRDTLRVSANEYFLLDQESRIIEFNTLEDTSNPNSEPYRFTYLYNGEGQLSMKKWFLPSKNDDIPFFIYNYTWLQGNLIHSEVKEGWGEKRKVMASDLLYHLDLIARDFLYFFPDAHELSPYIFSVDVGKKSKNLPREIKVRMYDAAGNEEQTYQTDFKEYRFSEDKQVTEFFVAGDILDGLPVMNGRIRFEYECK